MAASDSSDTIITMKKSDTGLVDLGRYEGFALQGEFWKKLRETSQACYRVYAINGGNRFIQEARINSGDGYSDPEKNEALLRDSARRRVRRRISDVDFGFGRHYRLLLNNTAGEVNYDREWGPIQS